jgi:hypothetical protein
VYSLHYAAPEVVQAAERGERAAIVTGAADMWALGVIAFELLTSSRALPPELPADAAAASLLGRAPLPWEAGNPGRLALLFRLQILRRSVLQLLSRDPDERPSSEVLLGAWNSLFESATGTTVGVFELRSAAAAGAAGRTVAGAANWPRAHAPTGTAPVPAPPASKPAATDAKPPVDTIAVPQSGGQAPSALVGASRSVQQAAEADSNGSAGTFRLPAQSDSQQALPGSMHMDVGPAAAAPPHRSDAAAVAERPAGSQPLLVSELTTPSVAALWDTELQGAGPVGLDAVPCKDYPQGALARAAMPQDRDAAPPVAVTLQQAASRLPASSPVLPVPSPIIRQLSSGGEAARPAEPLPPAQPMQVLQGAAAPSPGAVILPQLPGCTSTAGRKTIPHASADHASPPARPAAPARRQVRERPALNEPAVPLPSAPRHSGDERAQRAPGTVKPAPARASESALHPRKAQEIRLTFGAAPRR